MDDHHASTQSLELGISTDFHDKTPLTDPPLWWLFITVILPLRQFVDHVLAGYAFTPATFKNNHRLITNFIAARLLVLDIDTGNASIADLRRIPFLRRYAFFIYHTASSTPEAPRLRIVFLLSEPVTSAEAYRALVKAVADYLFLNYGIEADNTFDPARMFYGSTNTTEEPYINYAAALPLTVAGGLTYAQAEAEYKAEQKAADAARELAERPSRPITGARREKWEAQRIEAAIADLRSTTNGRNNALVKAAFILGTFLGAHWAKLTRAEAERLLLDAAAANGYIAKDGMISARSTMISGLNAGMRNPQPEPAEYLPAQKRATYERQAAPAPAPDLEISAQYLTLPAERTPVLVVQSGVGTGKTQSAIRAAAQANKVLCITHRERLAENFSRNAGRAGVAIEHYKELNAGDMRVAPKLAICINTYSNLADGKGGKLPKADLLILDEIDQLLQFVYGDNELFTGNDAIRAAEALKFAIKSAQRVIAFDAHISQHTLDFLRELRGADQVTFIHNTYQAQRGRLTLHEKRDGAIEAGLRLIAENAGTVVFADASADHALKLAQEAAAVTGDADAVLVVTRDNAGGERQRAFLRDPNAEIGRYRALIYSPIIGTGYDITAPVRAVIMLGANFQTAEDARQMLGRCRNTQEAHAWLPNTSASREEDATAIYEAGIANARRTHYAITPDGGAQFDIPDQLKDFHSIHSVIEAGRNQSMNALRGRFAGLLDGYEIAQATADAPELRAQLRAIAEAHTARLKELALTLAPLDADAYRRHVEAGTVTDEIEAAARRGKIENVTGLTISPDLRDRLWNAAQRAQLRAFTDLLDDYVELQLADAEEEAEIGPLHRRQHRTVRRNVCNDFLNVLIAPDAQPITLEADELNAALGPVIEKHAASLRGLFGWRPDRCAGTAAIARRVLGAIGLKLDAERRMVNGERLRYYSLDASTLAHMQALAHARLDKLRRERAEDRPASRLPKTATLERNTTAAFGNAQPDCPKLPPLPPVNPYAMAGTCAG